MRYPMALFLLHDKTYSFNGDGSGHCSLDIQYNSAFCGIFHWALVCSCILLLRLFAGGVTIRCSSRRKLSRDIFCSRSMRGIFHWQNDHR